MIPTIIIPLITFWILRSVVAVAIWNPIGTYWDYCCYHSAVAAFDAWGHNLALSVSEKTTPKPFTVGQNFPPTAVWRRSRALNVSKAICYAKATLRAFSVAKSMLSNNKLVVTYCFVWVSWQTRFLFFSSTVWGSDVSHLDIGESVPLFGFGLVWETLREILMQHTIVIMCHLFANCVKTATIHIHSSKMLALW